MPALTLSIPVRTSLALLLAVAAGAAHAEVVYRAREVLGPAEGSPVWAYALNNTGSVAGNTDDRAWGAPRDSFILKARGGSASYTAFQPLGATYSETYGINDLGDTVGYAMTPSGDTAFLKPSGKEAIALFRDDDRVVGSYASAVNASRVVTGDVVMTNGHRHAFVWKAGVATRLPSLGGKVTFANAINASGVVAGASVRNGRSHAIKWVRGVRIDLGGLGYTDQTGDWAAAINDAGWVAGFCAVANYESSGCVWHDGMIDELPPLVPGSSSQALDINNSNVVVGFASIPFSRGAAVIWTNGVITDLNTLVKLPAGLALDAAQSINDKGQILAYGVDPVQQRVRHFVLVPVTTP